MGTWIKETETAIYLMEGAFFIDKIAKSPSKSGNGEKTVDLTAMKKWFSRPDAPGAMTISLGGGEPQPKMTTAPPKENTNAQSGPMKINQKGLHLLKSFEGLRLEAYLDAVGVWTIGYGTTSGVKAGMKITQAQAEEWLQRDLRKFEAAVEEAAIVPLNENQFSALVSFTYNVGIGAFNDSTLLKLLNQKDYKGAAEQLLRWDKGDNGPLPGLTRRRKAERALFLGEDYTVFLA